MANKLVPVFKSNVPSRENTSENTWDFESVRVGADNLPISQEGTGVTARIAIGSRLKIAVGTASDDATTKQQMEDYVGTQTGALTGSDGVERTLNDFHIAALGVTEGKIAAKAVTSGKIGDGAVGSTQIASKGVATGNIADQAVDTLQIKDDAVTSDKIADNAVVEAAIASDAVTTIKIKDGNVTEGKIATGAVTETKIGAKAVTSGKIGDGAVGSTQIASKGVATSNIADQAVDTLQIKDLAVTSDKLANNSVIEAKIATDAVTNLKIKDAAVSTSKIAPLAVTSSRIADRAVTTTEIAINGVHNENILNESVTGNKIKTTLRNRIGIDGDLTYEAYGSTAIVAPSDTYPTAITALDAALETIVSAVPQQYVEAVVNPLGLTIVDVTGFTFVADDAIPDICVTVNGKKQSLGEEYNKTTTSRITFTYTVPYGAEIIVHKERTGGVSGGAVQGLDIKQNGSTILPAASRINFTGTGVTVSDAGGNQVDVDITGGGGGTIDLSAVDQDIVPDTSGARSLGSVSKGWGALYLRDATTGDIYALRIDNGFLEVVLM